MCFHVFFRELAGVIAGFFILNIICNCGYLWLYLVIAIKQIITWKNYKKQS